jgi:hypothetical protein
MDQHAVRVADPQATSLDISWGLHNGAASNRRSTRNLIEAISPQCNVVQALSWSAAKKYDRVAVLSDTAQPTDRTRPHRLKPGVCVKLKALLEAGNLEGHGQGI